METQLLEEIISETGVIKLKTASPSDIVVTSGESWKCPVYVKKMPPCRSKCPSSEDIRGYLTYVAQSKDLKRPYEEAFDEAWRILTDKNPFPAVHGRICPHPCESGCNRQHIEDGSVAINNFERVVGDHGIKRGLKFKKLTDKKRDKKVAIIGAGPSGLSCAYQMARRGYPVTVFESSDKPGGMLRYGITSYRLPREVLDAEIQNILDLGVELKCNTKIGVDISFEDLKKKYDAVYVAVGAQNGSKMNVEGEGIRRVFTGVDFLRRINNGEKVDIGKKIIVVGGGNTAIDAARTCRRLGGDVTILYRRTRNEMPAIEHEIAAAEEEGVKFEFLAAPVCVLEKGEKGACAVDIKCIKMKLGEKDKSGRFRPVPIEGSDFSVGADTVIAAIGQEPDLTGMDALKNKYGWIDVNKIRETAIQGVYAGGDVLGLDIATTAVGHGRMAAKAIEAYLNGQKYREPGTSRPIKHTDMKLDYYPAASRNELRSLPVEKRINTFEEVNMTLTMDEAIAEAQRCMSCGLCFTCDRCRIFCPREAVSKDKKMPVGQKMFTDYTKCNGCHICAEVCPCGYIEMGMGL
ncbi:MAG: FAD-dependent oxidoreductase [Nitrospirae bacterium]|nr:FAD-dependent oxidoreductase [Nitrospirota bacterium]